MTEGTPALAPAGGTGAGPATAAPPDLAGALSAYAAGVTLVTIADGRDDIGTTVSAFCPVSLEPPLVLVSLLAASYPAELLGTSQGEGTSLGEGRGPGEGRGSGEGPGLADGGSPADGGGPGGAAAGRFAVCLLAAGQRMLAGRFAAAGRPNARRMLAEIPHRRGVLSGALIVYILSIGYFITPALMGGQHDIMIAMLIDRALEVAVD